MFQPQSPTLPTQTSQDNPLGVDPNAVDPTMDDGSETVDPIEARQRLEALIDKLDLMKVQGADAKSRMLEDADAQRRMKIVKLNEFFRKLQEMGYDLADPNDITRLISDLEDKQPGSSKAIGLYLDQIDPGRSPAEQIF